LGLMISEVFSNLSDSMSLWFCLLALTSLRLSRDAPRWAWLRVCCWRGCSLPAS